MRSREKFVRSDLRDFKSSMSERTSRLKTALKLTRKQENVFTHNEVVCTGIPVGIDRSWRFLHVTLVPEQLQGLAVTQARLPVSSPSDNPHKAKHIATKAFTILLDAIFVWNPQRFHISHGKLRSRSGSLMEREQAHAFIHSESFLDLAGCRY